MDNDADWVFVENKDECDVELLTTSMFENTDQEDLEMKNEGTYATVLLKNGQQNHQHRSVSSTVEKKEKSGNKRADDRESMAPYIEAKPGSQYRNPRDKAGKNKVHTDSRRTSPPSKTIVGNVMKGRLYNDSKRMNRLEHKRNLRQQCSASNWKDNDY